MILRNVRPRDTLWFLLSSALLSAYLLFDDFFLFHEDLASRYLGLDENVVFGLWGLPYLLISSRLDGLYCERLSVSCY